MINELISVLLHTVMIMCIQRLMNVLMPIIETLINMLLCLLHAKHINVGTKVTLFVWFLHVKYILARLVTGTKITRFTCLIHVTYVMVRLVTATKINLFIGLLHVNNRMVTDTKIRLFICSLHLKFIMARLVTGTKTTTLLCLLMFKYKYWYENNIIRMLTHVEYIMARLITHIGTLIRLLHEKYIMARMDTGTKSTMLSCLLHAQDRDIVSATDITVTFFLCFVKAHFSYTGKIIHTMLDYFVKYNLRNKVKHVLYSTVYVYSIYVGNT